MSTYSTSQFSTAGNKFTNNSSNVVEGPFRSPSELSIEVTLQSDDLRITGSWNFERDCAPAAFLYGMAILVAMARAAERAQTAPTPEARAA